MSEILGILMIFFFSVLFPLLSFGGFILPAVAYAYAPKWAGRFGLDVRDEIVGFVAVGGLLVIASFFAPPIFISMNGALMSLAPVAAIVAALVGIGWALRGEAYEFGERFWHFARHAIPMTGLFVLAMSFRYFSRYSGMYDAVAGIPGK